MAFVRPQRLQELEQQTLESFQKHINSYMSSFSSLQPVIESSCERDGVAGNNTLSSSSAVEYLPICNTFPRAAMQTLMLTSDSQKQTSASFNGQLDTQSYWVS